MYYVTSYVSLQTLNVIDRFFFMHVRIPHVLPVLADNFFLFHMRVYFELPLFANLSHVRNIFFESIMHVYKGRPARFHVIPRLRDPENFPLYF